MRLIDTHLHLIDLDRFSYPWLARVPALNQTITLGQYRCQAGPLGVDTALHMEVDVAEADIAAETAWAGGLGGPIVGTVAACRPEQADFAAQLDRLSALEGVRGVRRILHTEPDELGRSALFADNLRMLSSRQLSFDLCLLARQLPIGIRLADACPEVQFILDHCGVPDIAGQGLDPWRAHIIELARRPNVACKISGIVAYAGPDWTVEDLRPYVEHCIESFGWQRVVWGSDFPVCTLTASLQLWIEATRTLIAGADPDDQKAFLSTNAMRLYKLS